MNYAKTNGANRRTARSALLQPLNLSAPFEVALLPLIATELTAKRRSSTTPLARLHPPGVNETWSAVKRLPPPTVHSDKKQHVFQGTPERNTRVPDRQKSTSMSPLEPPLYQSQPLIPTFVAHITMQRHRAITTAPAQTSLMMYLDGLLYIWLSLRWPAHFSLQSQRFGHAS